MSWDTPACAKCNTKEAFDRIAPFLPGDEASYAIGWRCLNCNTLALDVCPCGPIVPSPQSCLNCGADREPLEADTGCSTCGMTRAEIDAMTREPGTDPVATAEAHFQQGRFRRGLAVLNRALATAPGEARAWEVKARVFEAVGFSNASATCFERALAAGGPATLRISLGIAYFNLGKFREAAESCRAFLADHPPPEHVATATGNLANALASLDELAEAETLYKRAIEAEPARGTHYFNYARLCLRPQGRAADALTVLTDGLANADKDAAYVLLLTERSLALIEARHAEEAVGSADSALALAPKDVRALYLKGRALGLLGRLDEAVVLFDQVLAFDPTNADALRAKPMLERALGRSPPGDSETRGPRKWWEFWK